MRMGLACGLTAKIRGCKGYAEIDFDGFPVMKPGLKLYVNGF